MTQQGCTRQCVSTCHSAGVAFIASHWPEQIAQAALPECGMPPGSMGTGQDSLGAVVAIVHS